MQITVEGPTQIRAYAEDLGLTRAQYDEMMNTHGALQFSVDQILGNDDIGFLNYTQLTVSIDQQPGAASVTYYAK